MPEREEKAKGESLCNKKFMVDTIFCKLISGLSPFRSHSEFIIVFTSCSESLMIWLYSGHKVILWPEKSFLSFALLTAQKVCVRRPKFIFSLSCQRLMMNQENAPAKDHFFQPK